MKYALAICLILTLPMMAFAQQVRPAEDVKVVLQAQILEVSLTKLQKLGLSLEKVIGKPHTGQNGEAAGSYSGVVSDGSEALQVLEMLRKNNVASVLADPTLVTCSGRTAMFNSGEDIPVPKQQPDGSMALERQPARILEVTPNVLHERIHLMFRVQLAELAPEHSVRVGQQTVPGVLKREVETRAEVSSGQTLVLLGPTQSRTEAYSRGLPVLGEIPYLGAVFRKVEEEQNEIVLLILVRAEILSSPATAALPAPLAPANPAPTRR